MTSCGVPSSAWPSNGVPASLPGLVDPATIHTHADHMLGSAAVACSIPRRHCPLPGGCTYRERQAPRPSMLPQHSDQDGCMHCHWQAAQSGLSESRICDHRHSKPCCRLSQRFTAPQAEICTDLQGLRIAASFRGCKGQGGMQGNKLAPADAPKPRLQLCSLPLNLGLWGAKGLSCMPAHITTASSDHKWAEGCRRPPLFGTPPARELMGVARRAGACRHSDIHATVHPVWSTHQSGMVSQRRAMELWHPVRSLNKRCRAA